jgi:hypothetical protein
MQTNNVTILYRPVGPEELALIEQSGYTKFPPRLPEQPIFHPVMLKNTLYKSRGTGMFQLQVPALLQSLPFKQIMPINLTFKM